MIFDDGMLQCIRLNVWQTSITLGRNNRHFLNLLFQIKIFEVLGSFEASCVKRGGRSEPVNTPCLTQPSR